MVARSESDFKLPDSAGRIQSAVNRRPSRSMTPASGMEVSVPVTVVEADRQTMFLEGVPMVGEASVVQGFTSPIDGGGQGNPIVDPPAVNRENEASRFNVVGVSPLNLEILRRSSQEILDDTSLTVAERRRLLSLHARSTREIQSYFEFLSHRSNRRHFDNPPRSTEDLRQRWDRPGYYPLMAPNRLGEVVGGVTIADAERDQHDHWITKAVVDPKLQGRKVGTQVLYHAIEWAFSNPTYDGRERSKLDISIIMFVPGWERMFHLVDRIGFEIKMILPEQVTIRGRSGEERKPTMRFELRKNRWIQLRGSVRKRINTHIASLRPPMLESGK